MIEIFKTNVETVNQAETILSVLNSKFPDRRINFDLEDIDNILRIESENIDTGQIEKQLALMGFECKVLEDVVVTHY